jgi:hypothetical protein
VEDGRPFCPQCRAPQIHVQVAIPEGEAAGLNSAQGTFSPELPHSGHLSPSITARSAIDRSMAVRVALQAGVLGIFLGMIPILGIVLTGALAAYLYHRQNRFPLPAALAARIGGAAGVVSFAINAVMITIQIFMFHAQQKYADEVATIFQRFGANVADPDMQASIHSLFTPAGLAVTFFFGMIVSIVLASIGGALASLFLRPGHPRV